MGSRLLPDDECLVLHSPDGVSAPAQWRVPSTFTRWGPGSCPVASVLSYIHPMGARLLPGGECLVLHSPDEGPAPARWRVPSPTFTRWGPGSCPVASVCSYIHPMGAWLLPGGECLLLHSPDGGLAPARWRVSAPTFTRWGPGTCPVASVCSYIHPMGARHLPGGECLLVEAPAVNWNWRKWFFLYDQKQVLEKFG